MKFFVFVLFSLFACCLNAQQENVYNVVPKPSLIESAESTVLLKDSVTVYAVDSLDKIYLSEIFRDLGLASGFAKSQKRADIILTIGKKNENLESYRLAVNKKDKISATAVTNAGLLYALQTLRQLAVVQEDGSVSIPCCVIEDAPAFSWRAYMLDESRHFQGKETVKRLIDEMARLKMNTFHWHLVDDPGWRIEIKKYPRLTKIGSKRDFSHREISTAGWDSIHSQRTYYTQDEIREIVKYAAARGIRIIPEIEMPAHASASIAAYTWLGTASRKADKAVWGDLYQVCDPRVRKFLENVMDEIIALFPSKIIHIGGDEANYSFWQNSGEVQAFMKNNNIPTCADLQLWAINKMSDYLSLKGCRMIGWNEITGDNIRNEAGREENRSQKLADGTIVQFWDGDISLVNKAIDKGYDVVNSDHNYTYLDYTYEAIPLEKSYSFSPVPEGLPETDRKKILGSGCQMWGEFTPNLTRIYYQTFPRIAAYAECGWTSADNKNYDDFCLRMKNVERRWRRVGYFNQQPSYSRQGDTFVLWQLPTQINTIGNSYVIKSDNGKIIVIDGGVKEEEGYLRGFLANLGNRVDCWFVSHPHSDHIGALKQILLKPNGLKIDKICQSTYTEKILDTEPDAKKGVIEYYDAAKKSGVTLVELTPGQIFTFGHTTFKILCVRNEDILTDYNNSSVVMKVSDPVKSVLFLGDAGAKEGEKLLNGEYRKDLDCDYMQMAHHGQNGVSMDFYRTVKFRACLWPTPSWVYNNDAGKGFNTHILKTIETRNTIDSLGITEQYISFEGLTKIE